MSGAHEPENADAAAPAQSPRALPEGYRQGLITAITVLLGFSLAFFRFWGFEVPGAWSIRSIVSTGATVIAVALQIVALFRSLRLEDNEAVEYRKTVWWFIASVIALALGLLFAFVESFGAPA
ncbi:MAG TPA: hypothetical protein VFK51_03635 [Burkholderiales bacterium]|nr:hypothetical protein [Burkholderiales bacterium]